MKKVGLFISIPKCASKTILNLYKLGKNRDNDKKDKIHPIIYENHQTLKILENKYNLKDKFIFTFVRNPYDRIISWYNYHRNSKKEKENKIYKKYSLNEWIDIGCPTHWIVQNKTNWKEENKTPLLQYNFIEGNTNINFIGRIENFEEDNKKIMKIFNEIYNKENIDIKLEYNFIKDNSTKRKDNNLTDESKDKIYRMFKKDFDEFNYEK